MGEATAVGVDEGDESRRSYIRRLWIAAGVLVVVIGAMVLFGIATRILLTIFAGMLVGVFNDGLTRFVQRHTRLGRTVSLALVLLVLSGATVGFAAWFGPLLVSQLDGLTPRLVEAWDSIRERLSHYRFGRELLEEASFEELLGSTRQVLGRLGGMLATTLGGIATLLLIVVFGIYFSIAPRLYVDGALKLAPPSRRARLDQVAGQIGASLRSWLAGRFVSMAIVWAGTAFGLYLIDMPMAFGLGFIAGALSFVPNIGPIVAAIPGILVGLSESPMTAVWALLVYGGVQLVESYAITPFIEQRVVSLPPALLLGAQLLLGWIAGILGVFMATPLAVTAIVAIQMLYVQDVLGERVVLLGEHDSTGNAPTAAAS